MKRIFNLLIMSCIVMQLSAQLHPEKKPSTLVFHTFYNDFETARQIKLSSLKKVLSNDLWSKIGDMQMGFGFNYMRGISRRIDLITTLDGSSTDYLYKDGTTNGSSEFLLDVNAGLNIKLLTDHHTLVPYFSGGAGFSVYRSKTGFYIPVGAGLQFNLFHEAFIFSNVQYRFALTSDVNDHFYYSVGIGTSIDKKKVKPVSIIEMPIVPEPVKKEIIIPSRDIIIAVMDEATGQPLPYVEVILTGSDGEKLTGSTDVDGKVIFKAVMQADYFVSGLLNNIITSGQYINKSNFETSESQISISITHNDPQYTLSGVVINKTKNIPEGGAVISVTNVTKYSIMSIESHASDGVFRAQLEAESDFTLVGKKAGYISNIEKISTKGLNRSTTLYVKLELVIEEAKVGQSIVLNNIYFEVGKAYLNTSFSSDLDKLIQFLKDNPGTRLEIQGHTDNVGSMALNTKLSQARSNSVVEYLTKNGIENARLSAIGFGPSLPIADNSTVEGRAKNRRVVMKVIQ
jgi:outer membrane protein OmpA-like peptidoglycan-associated protein/5-hydroxyisourate hydrolase-like protein (transthyretin family)